MFDLRSKKMRRKAYISRFFILYLNPISLVIYGIGCYHLFQYILEGKGRMHILTFTLLFTVMILWFIACIFITIHMKLLDTKRKLQEKSKEPCICCKQTMFHIISVFFVAVFLCITGITIGGICCHLQQVLF